MTLTEQLNLLAVRLKILARPGKHKCASHETCSHTRHHAEATYADPFVDWCLKGRYFFHLNQHVMDVLTLRFWCLMFYFISQAPYGCEGTAKSMVGKMKLQDMTPHQWVSANDTVIDKQATSKRSCVHQCMNTLRDSGLTIGWPWWKIPCTGPGTQRACQGLE